MSKASVDGALATMLLFSRCPKRDLNHLCLGTGMTTPTYERVPTGDFSRPSVHRR